MSNFKCQKSKCSAGFTLIELLVTIAIIGILSSILLVNLNGFRQRARDTERKKDLLQIQTALELYHSDNSTYPANLPSCGSAFENNGTNYISSMPCDPLSTAAWGTRYFYAPNGSSYTLYTCLENASDTGKDATKQSGCSSAAASYTAISP